MPIMEKKIICTLEYRNNYNEVVKVNFVECNEYYIIYVYINHIVSKAFKYEKEDYKEASNKMKSYLNMLYVAL